MNTMNTKNTKKSKSLKEIIKKGNIVNITHLILGRNIVCLVQERLQQNNMVYLRVLQDNTKGALADSIDGNKYIWKIEIKKLSAYFGVSLIGPSERYPEWLL